jgi:hypothetical protein
MKKKIEWVVFAVFVVFLLSILLFEPVSDYIITQRYVDFAWSQTCAIDPTTGKHLADLKAEKYLAGLNDIMSGTLKNAAMRGITDVAEVRVPERPDECGRFKEIRQLALVAFFRIQQNEVKYDVDEAYMMTAPWSEKVNDQYIMASYAIIHTYFAIDTHRIPADKLEAVKTALANGEWLDVLSSLDVDIPIW